MMKDQIAMIINLYFVLLVQQWHGDTNTFKQLQVYHTSNNNIDGEKTTYIQLHVYKK